MSLFVKPQAALPWTMLKNLLDVTDCRPQRERDVVDRTIEAWARQVPDFDPRPTQVFDRLQRVARLLDNNMGSFFHEHGIGVSDYGLMASLFRFGPPYMAKPSEIARASLLTPAGVTLRVDRLVKMSMVQRVKDPDDRRSVDVQLTDQGLVVVKRVALLSLERQRRMLNSLSVEEASVLETAFRKLERSLGILGWPDQ